MVGYWLDNGLRLFVIVKFVCADCLQSVVAILGHTNFLNKPIV